MNEQLFVSEVMENVVSFNSFMKNYFSLKYEKSFANNKVIEKSVRTDGLISTYDVFDNLTEYGEAVNDTEKFLQEYGDLEILEDKYDNSYNYNGYLDRYINFGMFSLENDQYLVTLSVGLGLDPRGGYTDKIAFIFESEEEFLEIFAGSYQLMDFEFTAFDGKKFYGSFDAGALSEFGYLVITNQETGQEEYYDEAVMDTTDKEDIKDVVAEILEVEDVKIEKVNYFWYPCF